MVNLFDSAVQAVEELDETEYENPLSAKVREEMKFFKSDWKCFCTPISKGKNFKLRD